MKKLLYAVAACAAVAIGACHTLAPASAAPAEQAFIGIDGHDLVAPDGSKFFITGTNLGNWLNPEGYMFGFGRTNSPRMIHDMLCEIVGPYAAADFWKEFQQNYITRADIDYIASTGANTVRLPFHYKLFTDEEFLGNTSATTGYERVDSVVKWCRDAGMYVILDMHDCPGGQTGDNIDDSYGYPWLMTDSAAQATFCRVWTDIARRYATEPVILGYELMNEPVATYFENQDELNACLQPLYKRAVAAIREVDRNHIILIGAPQWNGNFKPLTEWDYDDKIMFTCHRYGGDTTAEAIKDFICFRDRSGKPMFMGEIGHNSDEWQRAFVDVLVDNNIGYTFWPYKKRDGSCMVGITMPEGWNEIVRYADGPRAGFGEIRANMPDRRAAAEAMHALLDSCRFEHCKPQAGYIASIGLKP